MSESGTNVSSGLPPDIFRQACGQYATGVTVVTSRFADGTEAGMTANSFTSVSLDPPLVLVCVEYDMSTYRAIRETELFAIHVLGSNQHHIATNFAQPGPGKFDDVTTNVDSLGLPALREFLVRFQCELVREEAGGDHAILIGKVVDVEIGDPNRQDALGFFQGQFFRLRSDGSGLR